VLLKRKFSPLQSAIVLPFALALFCFVSPPITRRRYSPFNHSRFVKLGTNARSHQTRDYARYQQYKPENENSGCDSDDDHIMCHNLGIGQNIFHRLNWVSASDLYKPDMLYTIYLGLFKHMMDWIEGLLKKHG